MLGVEQQTMKVAPISVDRVETALRNKIDSLAGYSDNPSEAVKKVFRKFDKNHSGKLDRQEFVAALAQLNFDGYEEECRALFRRYDLDGSGYLELSEFGAALFGSSGDKKLRATSTIGRVREVLAARAGGFQSLRDLGRQFAILDSDKNGFLSKDEMRDGLTKLLRAYELELSRSEHEKLYTAFDKDGDGRVSYDEFLRGVRGDMNEFREKITRMAFDVLDLDKSGVLTVDELASRYDVDKHPRVISGEWTKKQAVEAFTKQWDKDGNAEITWAEFLEYYQWISVSVDSDDYYELMIRNAFHISGGEGASQNTSNRRVLVFHRDGHQSVEEIKNDWGIKKTDTDKMMANLREQGFDPVRIELQG